jgi:hypothetical protein
LLQVLRVIDVVVFALMAVLLVLAWTAAILHEAPPQWAWVVLVLASVGFLAHAHECDKAFA